jgi:hypothetical protein
VGGATLTTLEIAGWRVRLECHPAELGASVAARYAPFVALADAAPDLTVFVNLAGDALAAGLAEAKLKQDGKVWLLDAPGFSGTIDLVRAQAALSLDSVTPWVQIEHFLRVLYALLAERDGGLMFHAAGLLAPDTGQVYLFIGCSGSGKSTVVRLLSRQLITLNDDLILVRPERQGWLAYGTPFWNTEITERVGQTAHGPVARVCVLVKDVAVHLEPLSSALATAELMANCPVVNGEPTLLPDLLVRCRNLAAVVPVQRLHFRKDPGFWDLLSFTA